MPILKCYSKHIFIVKQRLNVSNLKMIFVKLIKHDWEYFFNMYLHIRFCDRLLMQYSNRYFFHTQTLPRDHNFYHSTSCGLISILCSFVIVLVIGVMTAPYWRNYRISMSAPNKLSFIVLVITANPDSAFMKIEETLNIIVNFILDDELFLV